MNRFADRASWLLLLNVLAAWALLVLGAAFCLFSAPAHAGTLFLTIALCALIWMLAAFMLCLGQREKRLRVATKTIRRILAGETEARIPAEGEGSLERLFHEINSLAAILSAHADNETRARLFLKDTLQDISHQLKTPLAALNIYNGIIATSADDAASIREFAARSETELARLESLVQNLLKIARLDAGVLTLEHRETDLAGLLSAVAARFRYRAESEEKHLSLTARPGIVFFCDRDWLSEALTNLVKNAFDHTSSGGTIRITGRRFGQIVQIVVSDDGHGIAPEDLPHIFKRFYRSRHLQESQGVGLGLPLAKRIIEAHQGTIEVESLPGHGTTFTVNLLHPTKL